MRVLIVLTSHDRLGESGLKTGFRLDGFASAYYVLEDRGAEIVLASPCGGQPPLDPRGAEPGHQVESVARFKLDRNARNALADTLRLDQIAPEDFDAAFYAGGHGPMWDLVANRASLNLIHALAHAEKPIAFVCHGQAALLRALNRQGQPLVQGRRVTAASNAEEAAANLTGVVPFLLQDRLIGLGARFCSGPSWGPFTVHDGSLITGQNSQSAMAVAALLIAAARPAR